MRSKSLIILAAALVVASGARVSYRQCEDGSLCPDRTTCCQTASSSWACCPYESAQCCKDGVHCCPSTYRCDVTNGTCVHATNQERLFGAALEPVSPTSIGGWHRDEVSKPEFVPCPDGSFCNDGQTCCLLSSGGYGCCPYAHAKCCSDHASCCPEGYQCKVSTHQCIHATSNHTVAMAKKVDPVVRAPRSSATILNAGLVPCPDGSYCNDGQTCCLLSSGGYGCCPYAHAECCSDHASCCPEGYQCKVSTHQCVHATSNHTVAMTKKVDPVVQAPRTPETKLSAEFVPCPDGSFCNDGQTCCLLSSGGYGCCPYVHAECCSDHASCCPEGYQCKVSTHQCVHATSNHTVAMAKKVEPVVQAPKTSANKRNAELVPCPDGSYCNDGQTCCRLSSGGYGCCPYAHAECCSDHASCCPEGYQCKVSTHQCVHATSNHTVAMAKKVEPVIQAPKTSATNAELVPCPDGSYCNDGQTCCLLSSGGYGCCPYAHAKCCSDHASCCPEGYQCKVSTHQCIHATSNHTVAMAKKVEPVIQAPRAPATKGNAEFVPCPDGSYCNDGQTCCLLSSGGYGCCPYAHAKCCSDHASCCPEGYQCKVSTHQCIHATSNHTVAMAKKVEPVIQAPKTPASELTDRLVPCPDGSYCNDGQTCCLLSSGGYGCCPYTHAECCSDHASCCPEGYQCKVSTHQCVHAASNHTVAMAKKVEPVVLAPRTPASELSTGNVPCPGGSYCKDNQTCCLLASGQYGCCPYPHAECCSDFQSCCPEGYLCNLSTRQCIHGTSNHTVAMVRKVNANRGHIKTDESSKRLRFVNCRWATSDAPTETTALTARRVASSSAATTAAARTPMRSAAATMSAAAPRVTSASSPPISVSHASSNHTVAMVRKLNPVSPVPKKESPNVNELSAGNIRCPDGNYCNDGQTCCLLVSGHYGCCPYSHAECCSDHLSCCPEGYQCKISTHQCVHASSNHTVAMVRKLHPINPVAKEATPTVNAGLLPCPDGSYCQNTQTCCLLTSGRYGCCPYSHAECCSDHLSCCPEGYQCKVSTHQCIHATSNHSVAMAQKVDPIVPTPRRALLEADGRLIHCPDGKMCFNNQTCCELYDKTYNCCPYVRATCCEDYVSCCPEGYRCIITLQKCVKDITGETVPMHSSRHRLSSSPQQVLETGLTSTIRCPDGHKCLSGQTCCQLSSGHYGCCPLHDAVCCEDHVTCCPAGYKCHVATKMCRKGDRFVPAPRKVAGFKDAAFIAAAMDLLPCPDGSYCQNTQTCCLLTSGRYGCCPYSHAQCCSDHLSCCPEGYRCKVSTHQCIHSWSNHSVAMAPKVNPVVAAPQEVEANSNAELLPCPDGSYCQNTQTCCLLTSGRYGCCPYSHAQCCSDHLSCCPEGYRCKVSTHQCVHSWSNHSVAMAQKVDPVVAAPQEVEVDSNAGLLPCPDGSYCQNTQTCCLLTSGRYGCCPYSHAQCCSDHLSCCPEGYRCKVSTHQCIHAWSNHSVAMAPKVDSVIPAHLRVFPRTDDVNCPDGHKCLTDQTCCQLSSGHYGCCPLPKAVCCEDHKSCCPAGYVCHVSTQTCQIGAQSVPMVQKVPGFKDAALIGPSQRNDLSVVCPDGSECDNDQTCCELKDGTYGCCIYNQAVCCDDKEHCCPQGYTCDTAAGKCLSGNRVAPALLKVQSRNVSAPGFRLVSDEDNKMCPDESSCPEKMTCCKSNNSTYVCCPFSEATCCKDAEHCCPKGFRCDEVHRTCVRELHPDEGPESKKFLTVLRP
ncbi:uncharacterized protein LOC144109531 [Amblyomma americanum]